MNDLTAFLTGPCGGYVGVGVTFGAFITWTACSTTFMRHAREQIDALRSDIADKTDRHTAEIESVKAHYETMIEQQQQRIASLEKRLAIVESERFEFMKNQLGRKRNERKDDP